jgi:hypothetical protein
MNAIQLISEISKSDISHFERQLLGEIARGVDKTSFTYNNEHDARARLSEISPHFPVKVYQDKKCPVHRCGCWGCIFPDRWVIEIDWQKK